MEPPQVPYFKKLPSYEGMLLPAFSELVQDATKKINAIMNIDSRESDIIVCAYAKSGTHWISEIIEQLIAGKAEYSTKFKGGIFLEAQSFEETGLADMPSPRNLNTHLPFRMLPRKHVELNAKIIHMLRNPKDVAVSMFHHVQKDPTVGGIPIPWNAFFEIFTSKPIPYGSWFEYEKDWERIKKERPNLNILTVYYENLKLNTQAEVKRLGDFLGVSYTDELIEGICQKVDFKNILKGKTDVSSNFSVDKKPFIYRKGIIGDWKNWFTVAQNEKFDELYAKEMKDSNLEIRFTQ